VAGSTSLVGKLGVKDGHVVAVLRGPDGWLVPDLPPGVDLRTSTPRRADVVVVFVRHAAELGRRLPTLGRVVFPDGALWVAWPRKAAGHVSDVDEQSIRDLALPTGLVDVKVAMLSEDWSGLKLVWRKERRGAGA